MLENRGKIKLYHWLTIIFSIIGILLSLKLFKIDIELWSGERGEPSFCTIGEFVNCDAVSMSEYSSFLGIPNSVYGLFFYFSILATLLFGFISQEIKKRYFLKFIYSLSFLSLIFSLYFAYVSLFIIKAFCILCFGTYMVNAGLVVFLWLYIGNNPLSSTIALLRISLASFGLKNGTEGAQLIGLKVILPFILIMGITYGSAVKLTGVYFEKRTKNNNFDEKKFLEEYYLKLPRQTDELSQTSSHWGNIGAPVKIYEFSDFKCPHCRRGAFLLMSLLKGYEKRVELYFKNYPLDSSCNKNLTQSVHPMACLMAKAVICSKDSGKFWGLNALLFANAVDISRMEILDLAQSLGIEKEGFEKCLDSADADNLLQKEIGEGVKLGINATPTFIINGRVIRGLLPPKAFQSIINYELSNANFF